MFNSVKTHFPTIIINRDLLSVSGLVRSSLLSRRVELG